MTIPFRRDARCETCGFLEEDYASPAARTWMRAALAARGTLVFERLSKGTSVGGFDSAAELRETVRELAQQEDVHPAVHLAVTLSREAARHRPVEQEGSVVQLNSSHGGVPKTAVLEAVVSWRGILGDAHDDVRHHGHAWQALCLYSADVISDLQSEGHPIDFGAAGENVTLSGLDWTSLRTGLRLEVGGVVCELTVPAVPCEKNAQWFADGDFRRMSHTSHPGWSRWYAAVTAPGTIRRGDPVRLSTPS